MSLSPPEYIRHMLEEIDYILSRIPDTDYESFVRDETLKRAFVRSVEIIGEASKKLPEDIKAKQQDVEWRKVSGMRDRLIHDSTNQETTAQLCFAAVSRRLCWPLALTKQRRCVYV